MNEEPSLLAKFILLAMVSLIGMAIGFAAVAIVRCLIETTP